MKVGIIGCGLIGQKRAHSLSTAKLYACTDQQPEKAESLAKQHQNVCVYSDWRALIADKNIDIVIISTPPHVSAEIILAAVEANKHILVEKPAARHHQELVPALKLAKQSAAKARVGFNHRYHRTFRKAKNLIMEGALGDLMYIRARYGHGGRLGYDKEWRANPALSGGGELIDQGVHLIDLARWLLGDFTEIQGFAPTYYWDMPVDDNSFLLLKTAKRQVAFLHVSCTEWKNTFSLEIYGKQGKLAIDGLGGSYGTEKLAFYKMLPEMGPPDTTIWEYPMADDSWAFEFNEFMQDIKLNRQPSCGLNDAYEALKIVDVVYKSQSSN